MVQGFDQIYSSWYIKVHLSQAWKTTRTITKPMTQQGKKKKKNANLNLIQDYIHKNARREK